MSDAGLPHTTDPEQSAAALLAPMLPPSLGRYRITAQLGVGGFGIVYKGYDDDLRRDVAIKVPRRERLNSPKAIDAYLAEARTLAALDHAGIVPVYDFGRTEDGLCYLISKFIEGADLKTWLEQGRIALAEAVEIIASVAEALHHAHQRGLVHRDIKPANILLERRTGAGSPPVPFVADFGLALREEDFGKGPGFAGTPQYMSPEQARDEGHRVDARTDIYSLGVVFYELLTGRKPYPGGNLNELLEQIKHHDPRPPRQLDPAVPRELDRICLKCLAKRAADRYSTAADLAEDLRFWQAEPRSTVPGPSSAPIPPQFDGVSTETPSGRSGTRDSDRRPLRIVPKGLRSFDAGDTDFFLELLPGPRDREGLPDSIRFWKMRIEETEADETFSVGVLYGPSGCGKSSLVKAGLLPRLADHVVPIYIEATPDQTEARLLHGLRRRCSALPEYLGLIESVCRLRHSQVLPPGVKVLLVIDQFEQWLHARRAEDHTELMQALRQCDGGRVQCLLLVRDDFWMAATRLMRDLEIPLIEGKNSAAVDLFDPRHARKVLAAYGRAFGALPDGELSTEEKLFLDQAVTGLAENGKVISVRLSLFAEMVKGKPWTAATLKEVGGTEGIGVTFLEETFSASTAPPEHRLHQKAARAVLQALLPEQGTDIKGTMRSRQELITASGLANRPRDFEDVLRILDTELRLVTPTDPEGAEDSLARSASEGDTPPSLALRANEEKFYQLTHDFLVPALRQWLTRKQRETRRGRAELRLADRAAQWHARPERRFLPAWWEWLNIRLFTRRRDWSQSQKAMMRSAGRYHLLRLGVLLLFLALLGWGAYEGVGRMRAAALVDKLMAAETAEVLGIVEELAPYRRWAAPRLREKVDTGATDRERLHARLALLPADADQVEPLSQALLTAEPQDLLVIRSALLPFQEQLREPLWRLVGDAKAGSEKQFRAAFALAVLDPNNPRWRSKDSVDLEVAQKMVTCNPLHLRYWMDGFAPVRLALLEALGHYFRNPDEVMRRPAATILAEYAADQPEVLTDLLLDATPEQYAQLFPRLQFHREQAVRLLLQELDKPMPAEDKVLDRDLLAQRQAQAAVILLQMGEPQATWPLLKHSPDPGRRTHLSLALGRMGTDPAVILDRLKVEDNVSARRALILSLGEYTWRQLRLDQEQAATTLMLKWYRDDPDAGIHSATDWLLRHGKQGPLPRKLDWKQADALNRIDRELAGQPLGKRDWYVTSKEGHTLAVVRDPQVFLMGAQDHESEQSVKTDVPAHRVRIPRSYAIATREVTVAQFKSFLKNTGYTQHAYNSQYSPDENGPAIGVTWFEAAMYCNWLSWLEGIPDTQWCYPKDIRDGMKLSEDYLQRKGYRLPTEAEWEYACRAGATTTRFWGHSAALLDEYAWYYKNSEDRGWPGGMLKPNDLGLFDMYGNVLEWCQDRSIGYMKDEGQVQKDVEQFGVKVVDSQIFTRVMRGGSFGSRPTTLRSAARMRDRPGSRFDSVGFRVARTMP